MRRDVNRGIVPMDKFPVVPYFLKIVERHSFLPGRQASALAGSAQLCFAFDSRSSRNYSMKGGAIGPPLGGVLIRLGEFRLVGEFVA
jgi:hypothetical protein